VKTPINPLYRPEVRSELLYPDRVERLRASTFLDLDCCS
jgi:hypothetical protein